MSAMNPNKPQLHVSGLNMLSRCGVQFDRRYNRGEIIPPGVALLVGTATHRSVGRNLRTKIDTGELLAVEECCEIARDALGLEWEKGVLLDDEEKGRPENEVRGEAVDKAVRLSRLHAEQRAIVLEPTHVERSWAIELDGYPLDLAGAIDIQTPEAVLDTKTSKKSPNANAADTSDQLTTYALAVKVLDGQPPKQVGLDYLVDLKRGPALRTVTSTRDDEDFRVLLRRVENAVVALEKGVFVPARQDDWWCSPRYCGYHATCPYARGRTNIALSGGNHK